MGFTLNKKVFAATRALGKGEHDQKWDYMYVNGQYAICTDTNRAIRITLPAQSHAPASPQLFSLSTLDEMHPVKASELVEMPEGLEAKSTGEYSVPNFDYVIPKPEQEIANITVTAKSLIELLKAASEVTEHAHGLIRLRICQLNKLPVLRLDAHRETGQQEFCGIIMGTIYNGVCIPGDKPGNPNTNVPVTPDETIDYKKLFLPLQDGRKFR